jgi:hypothetical protein
MFKFIIFYLGMLSTQRVESMHRNIKRNIQLISYAKFHTICSIISQINEGVEEKVKY